MSNSDDLNMNYLFGSVQICKVLFILNYGLKFFIYCATGSYFRNQLNQIKNLIPVSNEPLLELDRNPRKFEQFLFTCKPTLTVSIFIIQMLVFSQIVVVVEVV